jgi:hypothetical protein
MDHADKHDRGTPARGSGGGLVSVLRREADGKGMAIEHALQLGSFVELCLSFFRAVHTSQNFSMELEVSFQGE